MTRSHFIAKLVAPIAAGLFATAAFAHPSLVSSTPADKSQVSAPATIELKFSETLVPQFSAASLVMTGMPGMASHGPMKINASVAGAGDGKTMVIEHTPEYDSVYYAYFEPYSWERHLALLDNAQLNDYVRVEDLGSTLD
eukprot:gene623-868_t